jgi:hypothetical protein
MPQKKKKKKSTGQMNKKIVFIKERETCMYV